MVKLPTHRWALEALNVLMPRFSLIDQSPISSMAGLSSQDFGQLKFITNPQCVYCGYPFFSDMDGPICATCAKSPPQYGQKRRAPLIYDENSRSLVFGLKRGSQRSGLKLFGKWMAESAAELLSSAHFLIPVPLHPYRLFSRGFNQSVFLAAAISRETGIPLCREGLRRIKSTPSQEGLHKQARKSNMQAAFKVHPKWQARLKGKRLILIDDVLTTGATLDACNTALQRAAPKSVDAITLTRVVIS